ncbi:MAG TPA: hypothetical protein VNB06_12295 [Thermoanaerobaculia bacterium]|nr:hypothetical protein [Thermoanaerobaculia bacterium]
MTGSGVTEVIRGVGVAQPLVADLESRIFGLEGALGAVAMPAKANSERLAAVAEITEHAAQRALEAERLAQGQLLPAVVYELDDLRFDSGGVALDPGSASRLDQLAERLLAEGVGCHFEICAQASRAGADRGPLALELAEAIRRRLHQRHGLPLWRIHTLVGSCQANGTDEVSRSGDRAAVAVFRDAPVLIDLP